MVTVIYNSSPGHACPHMWILKSQETDDSKLTQFNGIQVIHITLHLLFLMLMNSCFQLVVCFLPTVSTANLIGANHGLDVIYGLIPQYSTKHQHTIKYVRPGFCLSH